MNKKIFYSPGFLEISLRQFTKNKLAIVGVYIIIFLFFIAVFAPLLANNKPLLLYTVFQDKYEDTFYALLSNLSIYQQKCTSKDLNSSQHDIEQRLHYINANIVSISPHLPKKYLHLLLEYKRQLMDNKLLSNPHNFTVLLKQLENQFIDNTYLHLNHLLRFPAFRNLTSIQIFFMILYPLFLAIFLFKFVLRNKTKQIRIKREIIIALLSACILSIVLRFIYPPVFDPSDYKELCTHMIQPSIAIFPLVPFGENENIITEASTKPTWLLPVNSRSGNYHLFGTDTNGRDVLCRMIWGTRISMSVGFIAISICLIIGIALGSLAGYFRGWIDISISRLIEIVICFPVFFLILTVLAFLRPSIINIMVVIGITGWTGIARLCRGEFLKLVKQDFVVAAHALGADNWRTIFKHILPNGLGPILVSASFGIAGAILTESALSFLGFGVPQPTASWGDLLNNGRNDIQGTWWLTIFPGLAIFITVTAFNLAGEGFRDAIDPRLKRE